MRGHLQIAEAMLKRHEGLRLKPYLCTAGKRTIAYGRNLDDKGISADEALILLANDIYECEADLQGFDYWDKLHDNAKAALLDLRFCVGPGGYRGFRKMNAALEAGDLNEAAAQILDSKFADQTGGRAQDLASLLMEPTQH